MGREYVFKLFGFGGLIFVVDPPIPYISMSPHYHRDSGRSEHKVHSF